MLGGLARAFPRPRRPMLIRCFSEQPPPPPPPPQQQQYGQQPRFNYVSRQPTFEGFDEETDTSSRRKTSLQPVSMAPPQQATPASNAVFPEEALQNFAVDNFPGMNAGAFPDEAVRVLCAPVSPDDIEVKPDGAIYLPEIKYRRILNGAFGPGGWALVPRGPHSLNAPSVLSREYALFARGRFVSQARGSAIVQPQSSAASSTEAVRSNALMRCCKDLGIASELWDRSFVQQWKDKYSTKRTMSDRFGNGKVVWVKSSSN